MDFSITDIVLLSAVLVASIVYLVYQNRTRKEQERKKQFSFMKLPPELRAQVFTYLIDPPSHPPHEHKGFYQLREELLVGLLKVLGIFRSYSSPRRPAITRNTLEAGIASSLEVFGLNWDPMQKRIDDQDQRRKLQTHPICRHLNVMRLVSKKFGEEFLETYCMLASPVFTVEASSDAGVSPFSIWRDHLHLLKNCTLRMIARPNIANAFDPREARVEDWALRRSLFASMDQMTSLKNMTLIIEACGNSRWNPLWLWYFISQAMKVSDVRAFNRIEFDMKDLRMPQPYVLTREARGVGWEWTCENGHFAWRDEEGIAIRKFCGRLGSLCQACHDDEEMDASSEQEDDIVVMQ